MCGDFLLLSYLQYTISSGVYRIALIYRVRLSTREAALSRGLYAIVLE
jgi:hypothetical protein